MMPLRSKYLEKLSVFSGDSFVSELFTTEVLYSYALPPTNSRSSASISSSLDYTQHAIPLYQQTIGAGQNRTVFYNEHGGAGSQPLINFFFNNGCINLGVKIALDLKAVGDWRWALNDSTKEMALFYIFIQRVRIL
jgi:hypothetical protein